MQLEEEKDSTDWRRRRGGSHRLELVAKVDLGGQDLEQHDDLLVLALAVLRHQRQDLHRRQLPPVVPCASRVLH